tara:strand:+ start:83 stop:352 length:270 start_codon:yes stop_codon:yes gene_type:complete
MSITLSSCYQEKNIAACDCIQILLKKNKNTISNEDRKICEFLSRNPDFIEEMIGCESYKKFIQEKVEKHYEELINPKSETTVIIKNETK